MHFSLICHLGGSSSEAVAINNSGQVAGSGYTTGDAHYQAFLYTNGTTIDLGALGGTGSVAAGINNLGQVVGYAAMGNNQEAFLYSGRVMTDLNLMIAGNSGWQLQDATRYQRRSQIFG